MKRATRLSLVATIAMVGSATIVAAAEPACRAAFEQLDTNDDTIVEQTEFSTNKVRAAYLEVTSDAKVIPFERTHFSRRAFDELDVNHDGELDVHEIASAPMFQFAWWDRSRDGVVDWTEFHAGCQELER